MKKRILLFTAIAGMCILSLTSYQAGPGANGFNCTGSETDNGNPKGCSATGFACHGSVGASTASIVVSIELDSAGAPIGHYVGGKTYTVKITGVNNSSSNLPKFGLQLSAVKGTVTSSSPVNAGTWSSTTPTGTHFVSAPGGTQFSVNVVEHSSPRNPTTGTGASGSSIVESFTWTAPASGTGTISFWGAVNATNNNGSADVSDLWNTATLTVKEFTASMLSVANTTEEISVKAFPNPVRNSLNVQLDNAQTGTYSMHVTDMNGKVVANEQIEVTSASQITTINSSKWAAGNYIVSLEKDGISKAIHVVK